MKKHLLFGLGLSICVGAAAQTPKVYAEKQNTLQIEKNQTDKTVAAFYQTSNTSKPTPKPVLRASSRAVTKKKFTSSKNPYGVVVSETNCLNANQATGTVAFTHRMSEDWVPAGVANPLALSGFIQCTFTTNNGNTWDSLLLNQDETNLSRYPSGALFNPSGNTSPTGLYNVVSGPFTQGSTGWFGNYFASGKLDKTNINVKTDLNSTVAAGYVQHFARMNMQATDTKTIVTGALLSDPEAGAGHALAYGYRGVSINYGTYNGTNNFTWTIDSVKNLFKLDVNSDPTTPGDRGSYQCYSSVSTAWSQNGNIGYLVFDGVDTAAVGDQLSYQPVVYKTTTGGPPWTKMPLGNYSTLPAINAHLIPSNSGTKKAMYSQSSGFATCVDANGNLHIVSQILSGSSDAVDSLGYTWTRNDHISYIYDTYTTSTGWDAILIDSLLCISGKSLSPFKNAGTPELIDARIQVSMTDDRTKLFYMWIDSDPNNASGENVFPDIKGRGYNVTTKGMTQTVAFTTDQNNFYMYASRTALTTGSTYSIPCTTSDSRGSTGDALKAFDHYYLSGIEFNEADFLTGIEETSSNGKVTLSQNYPNPFSEETSINVTLKESSNVSLDVFNSIGQKIISQKHSDLASGTHVLKVDGTNLTPGIYFYTIKAGNSTFTKKMIVK